MVFLNCNESRFRRSGLIALGGGICTATDTVFVFAFATPESLLSTVFNNNKNSLIEIDTTKFILLFHTILIIVL